MDAEEETEGIVTIMVLKESLEKAAIQLAMQTSSRWSIRETLKQNGSQEKRDLK